MISIKELGAEWVLSELERAIREEDGAVIGKCLENPLLSPPPDTLLKLANFLNPNGPRRKTGTKPSLTRRHQERDYHIALYYKHLCKNLEFERYVRNQERLEFKLEEGKPTHDENGNFAPVWKYPDLERKRNTIPLPTREKIEEFIRERYGIGERLFEKILAASNKKVIKVKET